MPDQDLKVSEKSNRLDTMNDVRGSVLDWQGGRPIDLKKKRKDGKLIGEALAAHIGETLALELENHKKQTEKFKRLHDLYKGIKPTKSTPWENCANTANPVPRSNTDAIFVRVVDAIFNKRRLCLMKPKAGTGALDETGVAEIERAFDNYLRNDLHIREKCTLPMFQGIELGTGVLKIAYESKNQPIYRYADDLDLADEGVKKYKAPETSSKLVKETVVTFRGPNVYPVDRMDFIISSDALDIDSAYLVGHRVYKRKAQLKALAAKNIYIKENVEKITPDELTDEKKEQLKSQGVDYTKTSYEEPYEIWELWTKYDVDEDGEEDDVVVVFHAASKQILKAIYNPIFYGYRPFVSFHGPKVAYLFDGEGVCEVIEQPALELDTLHNVRLDRLAQINLPIILLRTGVGLDKFKMGTGKVWFVDDDLEAAFRIITFPDVVYSNFQEEDRLIAQMDRAVGITPGVLGISTAERPVAKETMALQEESNKKFKERYDSYRSSMLETFYRLLESFAQYQPTYSYTDESGEEQVVSMPLGNIRDMIDLDLEMSTEQMNMEIRREMGVQKFIMVSDYATKVAGMGQMLAMPQIPPPFKELILQINDIGVKLMTRIMEDFDEREPEKVIPNLRTAMDVNAMMAPPMPPPVAPGTGVEPGAPPETAPPMAPGMGA